MSHVLKYTSVYKFKSFKTRQKMADNTTAGKKQGKHFTLGMGQRFVGVVFSRLSDIALYSDSIESYVSG